MTELTADDCRWLIEGAARPYLDRLRDSGEPLVTLVKQLRSELTAARVHLIVEQVELRQRALKKFSRAGEMFFTRRLLEQATDESIAAYKARRLARGRPVIDLCCGLGGDLFAFAESGPCQGVDRDPLAVLLAQGNCAALGLPLAQVSVGDAAHWSLADSDAWHIDPDRRPDGDRVTHLEGCVPSGAEIDQWLAANPHAAVKLAPATELPDHWNIATEREWIGSRGECRQQVAWFGRLAEHAGWRRATVVERNGAWHSIHGADDSPIPISDRLGGFVFDPHAAVRAARLEGALTAKYGLVSLLSAQGYLTGDDPLDDPLFATFEVLDWMAFDFRRLREWLRSRQVGSLEVKVRGAKVNPAQLIQKLKLKGDQSLTLLVMGSPHTTRAVLAKRR